MVSEGLVYLRVIVGGHVWKEKLKYTVVDSLRSLSVSASIYSSGRTTIINNIIYSDSNGVVVISVRTAATSRCLHLSGGGGSVTISPLGPEA